MLCLELKIFFGQVIILSFSLLKYLFLFCYICQLREMIVKLEREGRRKHARTALVEGLKVRWKLKKRRK